MKPSRDTFIICGHKTDDEIRLLQACVRGDTNMVKKLVFQGIHNKTAIHHACVNGHIKIATMFIQDIDEECFRVGTYFGDVNMFKFLLNHSQKYDRNLVFLNACINGYLKIIELIDNVDYNIGLTHACSNGHLHIVHYLLSKGVVPSDEAFEQACQNCHTQIVKLLGIEKFTEDMLFNACVKCNSSMIELLIKHIDVNITNSNGETPLHIACYHHYHSCAETLLENGANPQLKDRFGYKAHDKIYDNANWVKRDLSNFHKLFEMYGYSI